MRCECGNDEAILEVAFHKDYVWLCLKCLDKYFPSGGVSEYAKKQGVAETKKGERARALEFTYPKTRSLPEMQSTLW